MKSLFRLATTCLCLAMFAAFADAGPIRNFFASRNSNTCSGPGCSQQSSYSQSNCNTCSTGFIPGYSCVNGVCTPINSASTVSSPLFSAAPSVKNFEIGDTIKHAKNAAGLFPSGEGVIVKKVPWNSGNGFSYQVRCTKTGEVLPVNFAANELQ